MKRILTIFLLATFLFQPLVSMSYSLPKATPPETLQEAQGIGKSFLEFLPGSMRDSWAEAMGIWKRMYLWVKSFWERHIKSRLISFWSGLKNRILGQKDVLKEELDREKEVAEEKVKEASKSLWQRILEKLKIR